MNFIFVQMVLQSWKNIYIDWNICYIDYVLNYLSENLADPSIICHNSSWNKNTFRKFSNKFYLQKYVQVLALQINHVWRNHVKTSSPFSTLWIRYQFSRIKYFIPSQWIIITMAVQYFRMKGQAIAASLVSLNFRAICDAIFDVCQTHHVSVISA